MINTLFIGYDLIRIAPYSTITSSVSVVGGLAIYFIATSRISIFIFGYSKDYMVKLLDQKTKGDAYFLLFIFIILALNFFYLFLPSIELFALLYILSYLFDLFLEKLGKVKI